MANKSGGNKLIELKFGVSGGGALTGDSGAKILKDIQELVNNLESSPATQIKFRIDPTSLNTIKQQFATAFKEAITAATTSVTGSRGGGGTGSRPPSAPSQPVVPAGRIDSPKAVNADMEIVPRYDTAAAYAAEIKAVKASAAEALKSATEDEAKIIKATRDAQVQQLENEKAYWAERNKLQKGFYAEQKRMAQEEASTAAQERKADEEADKLHALKLKDRQTAYKQEAAIAKAEAADIKAQSAAEKQAMADYVSVKQAKQKEIAAAEAEQDAFYKKNKTAIDVQIEAEEEAGKAFSQQLRAQMEQEAAAEKQSQELHRQRIKNKQAVYAEEAKIAKAEADTKREAISIDRQRATLENSIRTSLKRKADAYHGLGGSYKADANDILNKIASGSLSQIELDEYAAKWANINAKVNEYSAGLTVARDKLNTDLQFKNIESSSRKYFERYESSISKNADLAKRWHEHIAKLGKSVDEGGYKNALEARHAWTALRREVELLGVDTETLGARVKRLFTDHFSTAIAMVGVHALQNALRGVYDNVVALDSAVTDLAIATGKSREDTRALIADYAEYAKELGSTTADVAAAADSWLRQGYSIEDSNKLIKDSMMLSKLGQMESAEATQALTSTMKGYQIAVAETTSIVDKFTAVDMEAAVSAGDIATAMAKTANSARLAGVDINRLTGYITAVGEATQESAEVTGNFYKTLFARMGNVKAGRLEDPETGEDLSDVERTLSGQGIKLRDNNEEFRNFGAVLDEVAAKWDSFSSVSQRAIAVAFGGTRQQERFFALMENYETAMKYAEIAADSAGTALEKYENSYLSGVEAAQNKFTASFEKLSTTVLKSGLITGAFDAGSGILSFFDKFLTFGDGVLTQVPLIITGFYQLYKGQKALSEGANVLGISFLGIDKVCTRLAKSFFECTTEEAAQFVATSNLRDKFELLTATIKKNAAAFWAHPLGKAAVFAAGALLLAKALDPVITTYSEWEDKLKSVNSSLEELSGEGTEYDNLSKNLKNLTAEEWERYWVLKSQTDELKEQQKIADDALFAKRKSDDIIYTQNGANHEYKTLAKSWLDDVNTRLSATDGDNEYLKEAAKITSEYNEEYETLNRWREQGKELTADEEAFVKRYGLILDTAKHITEGLAAAEDEAADGAANLTKNYEGLFAVLDSLKDKAKVVSDVYGDFGKNGKLGFSSLNDLRTQFADLPEIDSYITKLSHADITASELKSTLLEMVTALVQSKYETGELVAKDKELIGVMLEEQGVVNGADLAMRALAQSMFGVDNTQVDLVAQIESIMGLAMAAMSAGEQLDYLLGLTGKLGYIPNDAEGEGGIADQFAAKAPDLKYPGGGGGGSKAVEIDEFYDARQKLLNLEKELNMVLARRDTIDEDDGVALAENAKQALDLYKEQQAAMHELNNETDIRIQQIADQLRGAGFDVLYNADTNDFWISNIEHIKTFSKSSQETYNTLIEKATEYNDENIERSLEWWNIQKSILDLQKEIRDAEIDSLNSLVDMVKDQITQEYEDQIDALNKQVDAFDEIIERRKEILRLAERERGYQEDVAELTDEIAKLQAEADLLGLDDSRAASAQRGSVLEQLAAKQKELAELQRDNYVETTEEALDKESDSYKKSMDGKIEDLEDFLDDNLRLTEAAYARIDNRSNRFYDSLLSYALKYTDTTKAEFDAMWDSAIAAAEKYGSVVAGLDGEYTPEAKASRADNIISKMKSNSSAWFGASEAQRETLNENQFKLVEELREIFKGHIIERGADGVWYIDGIPLYENYKRFIYHNGGTAGDQPTPKQDEIFARLKRNEVILNDGHQDTLLKSLRLSDVGAKLMEFIQSNVPQISLRGNVNSALAGAGGGGRSVVVHSDIYINGSADESVLEQIKKYPREVANIVSKELKKF